MTVSWKPPCRTCGMKWVKEYQDWMHRAWCRRMDDPNADREDTPSELGQLDFPPKETVTVTDAAQVCTCEPDDPALCDWCAEGADRDDYTGETE